MVGGRSHHREPVTQREGAERAGFRRVMTQQRRVRTPTDSDPMTLLAEAMVFGTSESIERSEAEGQRRLVESTQIPIRGTEGEEAAKWAALGVVLGEKKDDLFRDCTLPAGWKMKATGHAMWSDLVDDKGRPRAAVFYKAAFYDRSAHVRLSQRYSVSRDYSDGCPRDVSRHRVCEGDAVLFATSDVEMPTIDHGHASVAAVYEKRDAIEQAQRDECCAWLDEHRPNHRDFLKQWDD